MRHAWGVIRRFQPEDTDAVVEAWRRASALAHPFLDPEFVAEEERRTREVYLPNAETWVAEVDGRPVQIGSTAAILGHPVRSLAAASRIVAEHGMALEPGQVVMAGGATAATWIKPGQHLRVVAEELGSVSLHVS